MSLAFLFHYLMLNMFRVLLHPYTGACDLFVELFHVLYCYGMMCVGVKLWFGWGGVVTLCRLKHNWSVHILQCTVKPRFTNASYHEQFGLRTNFPNTKRLG